MPRGRKPNTTKKEISAKVKYDIHGNEKSNSKAIAKQVKVKKVVNIDSMTEHLKEVGKKRGKPKNTLQHVMMVTDWLYITCDSHTWKLMEINDKTNPKTGETYPDKPLLYCPYLNDMIKSCAHYILLVPSDIKEIAKNIDKLYSLVDARIPSDIKPKDLFTIKEVNGEDSE